MFFGEFTRHKTLILDLDETLIHSELMKSYIVGSSDDCKENQFIINLEKGVSFKVSIRPCMTEALERLSEYFELSVFTAAEQTYADQIIDRIDPDNRFFPKNRRLYR